MKVSEVLWKFSGELKTGVILRREKRFLASIALDEDGREILAYCPNTGSMRGCFREGSRVAVGWEPSPTRKLGWTWYLSEAPRSGEWIMIHTGLSHKILGVALERSLCPQFLGYTFFRPEVGVKDSRLDFCLYYGEARCWIEVKHVTLWEDGRLFFPDSVSLRASKHMETLIQLKKEGDRAALVFLVHHPLGSCVAPASHIDGRYGFLWGEAKRAGVEIYAHRILASLDGLFLGEALEVF